MVGDILHLPYSFHLTRIVAPYALIVLIAGSLFIVVTAQFSLNGLDAVRKWTSIGLRLTVLWLLLLALCGLQWEQRNDRLDVMVACDVSGSTGYVRKFPGRDLQTSLDRWFLQLSRAGSRHDEDSVGELTFDDQPTIDALPASQLNLLTRSIRHQGNGTDPAAAINLAMAGLRQDSMHRVVLAWDGNKTTGDLDAAVNAAAAAHVPIDVAPLTYSVNGAVLFDKLAAPSRRRTGEPFTLDAVIRNTANAPIAGTLVVDADGQILATRRTTLRPGVNAEHISVPPTIGQGLRRFHARFDPDDSAALSNSRSLDSLRTANAFTFITGKSRVLYVDGTEGNEGKLLSDTLAGQGIEVENSHISPEQFPNSLAELEQYDGVILANIRRGEGGISDAQAQLLSRFVQDTGGGLLVIGGPNAFGAGGWIGTSLEKLLPVECSVPATRSLPAGALLLVIDHSGSMGEPVPGSKFDKQQLADEAAVLALQTMMPADHFGVIAFDAEPTWVVPLHPNSDAARSADLIRAIRPAGGTAIYPALDAAEEALAKLATSQAGIKHIILLTDGDSQQGDYEAVARRMAQHHITLSTIGVGQDVNQTLLAHLSSLGNGRFYPIIDPRVLPRVFIREASVLRRPLIHEDADGLPVTKLPDSTGTIRNLTGLNSVFGMVLTTAKKMPGVDLVMTAGSLRDPLLASWQAGLGRVAVFTSDAGRRWAPQLAASQSFARFWAELVRSIERAPADASADMQLTVSGKHASVRLELTASDGSPARDASASAVVLSPAPNPQAVKLVQQSPGAFTAEFDIHDVGENVLAVSYQHGRDHGIAVAGADVRDSDELRDLHSNDEAVAAVAARTGGRVLKPFDSDADLFDRDGLWPSSSNTPLAPLLLLLASLVFLFDVAARRIAWDRHMFRQGATMVAQFVRSHTTTPAIAPQAIAIAAVRARTAAKERFDLQAGSATTTPVVDPLPPGSPVARPSRPSPTISDSQRNEPSGSRPIKTDRLSNLKAAKRRAQKHLDGEQSD